jgi:hypothetical protein
MRAIAFAKKHLTAIVKPHEKDKRPGTRPADIKRYLKPLLKMRSDLVLVHRRVVVRPVRHLLRGALLDQTSDKYSFRMWCYIMPLFAGSEGSVGFGDYFGVANCPVWQPHFEPLLMDALAEDVFAPLGNVTTLADFPAVIQRNRFLEQTVTGLVLAGEQERALEYVEQVERDDQMSEYGKGLVRKQWERVSGDIEALCAEAHAREAETIKALKLEHIWEPSPFPVELPAGERTAHLAEPVFSTVPWVSRPSWLLEEVPQKPDEVRFAKDTHYRNGRVLLQVPLTREQAEQRHRGLETYSLAVRLPDGFLLLIKRHGWDRNDPEFPTHHPDYRPAPRFTIGFYGPSRDFQVSAHENEEDPGLIELWQIRAPKWLYYGILNKDERTIHDWRSGEKIYSSVPLTAAERDLIRCPMPGFGEYTALVARIRSLLEHAGYGELK